MKLYINLQLFFYKFTKFKQNLVKKYDIDWICVRDTNGLHSHAAKAYNIQSIPANYIINPKSEIVGKNLNGRRLEERLHDLLK